MEDLQKALTGVSLIGAAFSTTTTIYYWFVRVRNERPSLTCELADREFFLGLQTASNRQIGFKLGIVLANGSSLPNAVLGVRVWVKQKEGGWLEAEKIAFDKTTPRPINIPAMQTAFAVVSGTLTFPLVDEIERSTAKPLPAYFDHFMTNPREIKIELRGLNEQRFESIAIHAAVV